MDLHYFYVVDNPLGRREWIIRVVSSSLCSDTANVACALLDLRIACSNKAVWQGRAGHGACHVLTSFFIASVSRLLAICAEPTVRGGVQHTAVCAWHITPRV